MAKVRFPARKHARTLGRMHNEIAWWYAAYKDGAARESNVYLAARLEERAAVLYDLLVHLESGSDILLNLPRTSL